MGDRGPTQKGAKKLNYGRLGLIGIAGLVALSIVGGSFYTVDQRERVVLLTNGAVVGEADPGLHWKLPFVQSAVSISVESHRVEFDKMEAYSRDQQPAVMKLSVLYHVPTDRVSEVYSRFTSTANLEDRVVEPKVLEQSKNVFGQFDAVTAVQERVRLNAQMASAIHEAIGGMNAPIVIEAVQIEDIQFSPEYMRSIEQRMQASVEVDRLKQNALREKVQAEIVGTKAGAEANAIRQRAQAEADATKLRGDAEASAIRARAEALGSNPGLVALTQAERWDGKLPTTMVPGATMPMMNVGK
ncbi:SPFH domain-containing protein [Methylobacterium sp. A49B]